MSFGPSSAFGGFPSATRPPISTRRVASSGSFKDDLKQSNAHTGPTPIDHPSTPSLGSWESGDRDRENSAGSSGGAISNGHSHHQSVSSPGEQQRSFSSILSPTLPAAAASPSQDPLKPFVYSREFLLSLYEENKASRRPIELARHEIATRDVGGKPWALSEWREGEKELFSTSIHPASARSTASRNNRTEPSPSAGLDLSTLGVLPRERDRALASPSTPIKGSLIAGIGNTEERKRASLGSIGGGLSGGVLGSMIGNRTPLGSASRRETPGSAGAKEVWQGGRWRRGGTAEPEEDKRSSAFGARRFPASDAFDNSDSLDPDTSLEGRDIPTTWDGGVAAENVSRSSLPSPTRSIPESYEPDFAHHAANVLGSLALDADPIDDPLLSRAPPGLSLQPLPVEIDWQYRDPTGQVQGPFSPAMMHSWFQQNFFSGDLAVKRMTEPDYETLDALIRRSPDAEKPFLSAPLQPVKLQQSLSASGNWGAPTDQFGSGGGVASQRAFSSSFYEPFGASPALNTLFDQSRSQLQPQTAFNYGQQQQQQQQIPSLDPWGAPLPQLETSHQYAPTQTWHDNGAGGTYIANDVRFGGYQQQQTQQQQPQFQQQHQQQQYQQQTPLDLYRQPPQVDSDAFGRQSRQSSIPNIPFFDANQLVTAASSDWNRNGSLPLQQQSTLNQGSWSDLISPSIQARDILPQANLIPSPIGPVPTIDAEQASAPVAPISAWGSMKAPEIQAEVFPEAATLPALAPAQIYVEEVLPEVIAKRTPAPAPISVAPAVSATPALVSPPLESASTPTKTVTSPWLKDDDAAVVTSGPSLRQIQEAEARQSEARKTAERQAAARTQALAAVQAAQRAAAAEAESLPSTSTWAAAPASSPSTPVAAKAAVPAPWSKPQVKASGKSMKEIQEEEEKRKKAAAAVAAASGPVRSGAVGYAGSIGQLAAAKGVPGAPWTTVGIKPVPVVVTPVARPVIPGGPLVAPRAVSGTASLPLKPTLITPRPLQPPSRPSSTRSNGTPIYDADSPPPPSSEFMKWTRDALKGLTVPMDEFIQMLLSFPLEASADVLEIISDSVYANSSTLDGRRFANDYAARRKLDVAARYPNIQMSKSKMMTGSGRPTSMAEALKSQPVVKTPEWSVKLNKKKGGK